jgi:CBS domain-containing protein
MDSHSDSPPQHTAASMIVGKLMRPAVTTVERHAHLAAAAYLMRQAGDTALVITTDETRRPIGIVTQTDITNAVADGKDLNESRIDDLDGVEPVTVQPTTPVTEAAAVMLSAGFRHLPVVDDGRLVGIIDISDVCRALLVESAVS